MKYTFAQIVSLLPGTLLLDENQDAGVDHLLLDSRKLLFPSTTLFFAWPGPRRTGNAFIGELFQKGVRSFIVDEHFVLEDAAAFSGAGMLQVKDVKAALHILAAHYRARFSLPVIGITGSNGKTIVKEWLYQLLQEDYLVVRSPKSYNSQVGVPLSVWQLNDNHTLGIFEAGISLPGEMAALEKIIQPGIGILTYIGDAHNEGFTNRRQKIREKLLLFRHCSLLVYGIDNKDVAEEVSLFAQQAPLPHQPRLFSWGRDAAAILQVLTVQKDAQSAHIRALYQPSQNSGREVSVDIPFTDEASINNAISCWCVMLHFGLEDNTIRQRMRQLRNVAMRLELKQGINHCSVINDSYSADINSLTIALDFLVQQQQHTNRTVILSDILQTGKSDQALYVEVAAILRQKNIHRFIGIGPAISQNREAFAHIPQQLFFSSVADFLQQFYGLHFYNETILLKGARVFGFEQIAHLLEQKVHQTVLEINLDAVANNLRAYQQLLQPGVKIMAMVKAFSYGSGGFEIANLLQFHRVDYLAVAYADEGVELRRAGITLPILVLNPEDATFDVVVQYNLEPELYSMGIFHAFMQYLEASGISNYPVHIKLDTGMHRLGFEPASVASLAGLIAKSERVKIQSVFSHLASSDNEAQDAFTAKQADLFLQGCALLQQQLNYPFIRHIANTAAIHRHPTLQLDMVRLGIGLYGVDHDPAMQEKLLNVSTLKTTVSQIKNVPAGDSVGYNRKGIVLQDAQIATVRIGYADGYPRSLSNGNGYMWIKGALVPVIGNVCMDMTMLDVTGVHASEGDEVIVFGPPLPVSDVARWANTIPYEILTGISQRVKRVYYEE